MTYGEYTASKGTEELRAELKGLNEAIEKFECFNTRDLIMRNAIELELEKRIK